MVILLSILFLCDSCSREELIKDPSFCFNLVIVNPALPQKLSIDIRPPHAVYSAAMVYIHRMDDHAASLDYRENGVVRRNMLDSMSLDQASFKKFSLLVKQAELWEQKDIFGPRTDGNAYQFILSDSLRQHVFSAMGEIRNPPLTDLITFCTEQFELLFPSIPIMSLNSEIAIKKLDRVSSKWDSTDIRLSKNEKGMILHQGRTAYRLTSDEYIELWRILENNRIWDLHSDQEFVSKYPIEYRVSVKRGDLSNEFIVFAPSKIADKRYFNVINHIETLKTLE